MVSRVDHPLMCLALAADRAGALVAIDLGGSGSALAAHAARHGAVLGDADAPASEAATRALGRACDQLRAYLGGTLREFDLPLRPLGTPFQARAWAALRAIPYGVSWTYGEQAARLGAPKAVRAVGRANGQNPLPLVIPCHRVIGQGGALTGFAGGIEVKRRLLELERSAAPQLSLLAEAGG